MCFNETVSIAVFMTTVAYSLFMRAGDKNTAIFVLAVGAMQLAEYLAHKAIRLKNRNFILYATIAVYLVLILQPLVEFISHVYYPRKQYFLKHPFICFGIVYTIYLLTIIYLYSKVTCNPALYLIDSKYCSDTLCRLEWKALSYSATISTALFALYIIAHMALRPTPIATMRDYIIAVLIGLLYVLFVDKVTDRTVFGLWGSTWCIVGAMFLPFALFRDK